MKALTLTQPWASLVAIGAKQIETRSWFTNHRGPLAIHAAKTWTKADRRLVYTDPFCAALATGGVLQGPMTQIPLGAIVAVVNVIGCPPTHLAREALDEPELSFGNYDDGRFAWLLADVRALPDPIYCKGALGLWEVSAEIEQQIERQLEVQS